jgi:hypothetical protein
MGDGRAPVRSLSPMVRVGGWQRSGSGRRMSF